MTPVSEIMAAQLVDLNEELKLTKGKLEDLLRHCGDSAICRGCGKPIYWMTHLDTKRRAPYEADGTNHFVRCPKADEFRKERKRG